MLEEVPLALVASTLGMGSSMFEFKMYQPIHGGNVVDYEEDTLFVVVNRGFLALSEALQGTLAAL